MVKVLAGLTNNAEQSCGQKKGSKFKCGHFTKFFPVCIRFWASVGLPTTHIFVVCFNVVQLILF